MALNIKNAEVESLAAEVAKLADETKTEAIRVALKERAFRLKSYRGKLTRKERIDAALRRFREQFPNADYGRRLTKKEEESILGFGPGGSLVVLDSSAIVAILLLEPNHEELQAKIESAPGVAIGAPTLVETLMVLTGRVRGKPILALRELLRAAEAEVIPFSEDHSRVALEAYLRFGKGRHPAALNFGDCLSYATAFVARQPLLFVGNDFSETDIQQA